MKHVEKRCGWFVETGDIEMSNQAVKKDDGKPQLNLVPLEMLIPNGRVREFAKEKYGIDGIEAWREIDASRILAALLRHTIKYQQDPDGVDEESGLPHSYHMSINANFLAIRDMEWFEKRVRE